MFSMCIVPSAYIESAEKVIRPQTVFKAPSHQEKLLRKGKPCWHSSGSCVDVGNIWSRVPVCSLLAIQFIGYLDIYCFRTEAPAYSTWGHNREWPPWCHYQGKSPARFPLKSFLTPKVPLPDFIH